jgi:hypothetical protein
LAHHAVPAKPRQVVLLIQIMISSVPCDACQGLESHPGRPRSIPSNLQSVFGEPHARYRSKTGRLGRCLWTPCDSSKPSQMRRFEERERDKGVRRRSKSGHESCNHEQYIGSATGVSNATFYCEQAQAAGRLKGSATLNMWTW